MAQALVEIMPLHLIGNDERGDTYDFSIRDTSDFILIIRKAGTHSGNTYHKGVNSRTNPKIFVLLQGEIEFTYRHIEQKDFFTEIIKHPSIIKIQPFVTHAIHTLSDMLILECNAIKDVQDDRYRENVCPVEEIK
jgi:hypothetical protein